MINKRLISNFLSLSTVQTLNYILPLITVPYLVRVLGPEKFGLVAFSQAFIHYFILITDYGFNLSATREISKNRNDKKKVSEIFSSVMFIKVTFMLLSFICLTVLVLNVQKFTDDRLIYFFSFGMVIGNVLFPIWLFQGMEQMKQIALLNIVAKVIFTASIFLFIKSRGDYIYVPLLNSLGFVTAGLLSLWMVFKKFNLKVLIPSKENLKHEFKDGWDIFVSTIAMSLYSVSSIFILGLFTNNTIVGYFSAGEKIVRALLGLLQPLSQTIYPHISSLLSESKDAALAFIRKIFKLFFVPVLLLSFSLLVFAPQISDLLLGAEFKESIPVIKILSFLLFVIFLNNLLGIQIMLNFGYQNDFKKIVIYASFIYIILALILTPIFQHKGVAMALLITETYIIFHEYIFLHRRRIKLFQMGSFSAIMEKLK